MSQKPPRRTRRDLSLDQIVGAATDLLRDVEDSALTMRSLANACGVTPMAIYNHVEDKESLLTHVVDSVLEPLTDFSPQDYTDASEALLDFGASFRGLFLDHRGAATTFLRRPVVSANMTRVTELFFEMVDALDLRGSGVAETVDAVVLVTVGSIANDLTRPADIRNKLADTEAAVEAPLMVKHLDAYAARDGAARYRQTLRWILDGATTP